MKSKFNIYHKILEIHNAYIELTTGRHKIIRFLPPCCQRRRVSYDHMKSDENE